MIMHERLREARRRAGFASASEFARNIGEGESSYRHKENGTRGISSAEASRYSKILNVSVSWLLGDDETIDRKDNDVLYTSSIVYVPVVENQKLIEIARSGVTAVELSNGEAMIPIPESPDFDKETCVALVMDDHSMSRSIPIGAAIIVDTSNKSPEEAGIFVLEHQGDVAVRRYRGGFFESDSFQENFPPLAVAMGANIIGRAVYVVQTL